MVQAGDEQPAPRKGLGGEGVGAQWHDVCSVRLCLAAVSYSKAEYDFLVQAAKAHANALREQAISEFFDAAGAQALRALRAANRFAHSLARHARLRGGHPAH